MAHRMAVGAGPWLAGFWHYFTSSRGVVIGSNYSLEQTKERLLELNHGRDVYVRINAQGQVFMNATAHAGGGKGMPMIPELCAKFESDPTCTILTGSIGTAAVMKLFIWCFLGILLVGEFLPNGREAFPGGLLVVIGCFLLVMILCYETGRSDQKVIVQRLTEATGIEPIVV